jgi:ketosteroid isomerase-like protein
MSERISEPERRIQSLFDTWTDALRAKDVDRRTANYADDVVLFDVIVPTQPIGRDALRQNLDQWFS